MVGAWGETIALRLLTEHGATLIARNIRVGRGEVDLHVAFGALIVAVEVKTLLVADEAHSDPARSYTHDKAERVHRIAACLRPRPDRIDLVAVVIHSHGVAVRWVRSA